MKVVINGQLEEIMPPSDAALMVEDVLNLKGFDTNRVAVALNYQFVSRVAYVNTAVKDGDAVEVLEPMQGG